MMALASYVFLLQRLWPMGNILKSELRLGAWIAAISVVSVSGRVFAQSSTSGADPKLWTVVAAPLLSGVVGIIAAFVAIRFDARKTVNQELIKKRILIYDLIAPKLNDFLCFFLIRGPWKSLTPPLIIQRKRELDQAMYIYGPLFSKIVFVQYHTYINLCFKTYMGVGRDACLRANHNQLRHHWGADWKPEWDAHFVGFDEVAKNQEVMKQYDELLALLASEIGARQSLARIKSRRNWWHRTFRKS